MDATRIGPYRLVERLGAGSMGTVWLAEGEEGRVALKVFHPHLVERRGFLRRVQREAAAGRDVDHENVVRTLDCDLLVEPAGPLVFLVMEYVEGKTLRRLLDELGPLPEPLLREVARQAAAGLSAIHARRLVHRDVKPENLLITEDRRVRLMDLGIAKAQDATSPLTEEGQFAGSVLYASPEQVEGRDVGPATDLYGLGATLYVLASGRNPFRRESTAATLRAHLDWTPPTLRDARPAVSPFFAALVAALLSKSPAKRFSSAAALARVLEEGESSAWWASVEFGLADTAVPAVGVERRTSIHGREDALAVATRAWERARAGEGRVLLVEGEAGIGKSRLVDELLRRAATGDARLLYGSFPPGGGGGALEASTVAALGPGDLADALRGRLGALAGLAGPVASRLRREGAGAASAPAFEAAMSALLESFASERPVLWVVEDLHFATPEDRRPLWSLARAVAGRRALLVVTSRPGLPEADRVEFLRLAGAETLPLGRLSPREVMRLLREALGSDAVADRVGGVVAYKSDGVPYHVLEVLHVLHEDGDGAARGAGVDPATLASITVPSSVAGLVELRLADLLPAERAVLDAAAVVGFEFDPDLVARTLDRPLLAVLQALAAVERRLGLVRSRAGTTGFDHHAVQEVLYDTMPPALRAELHALVAQALAPAQDGALPAADERTVVLARHHVRGARPERGVPWYLPAARHLEAQGRLTDVLDLCERVLSRPGLVPAVDRARILQKRAGALARLGRRDDALLAAKAMREAARESGDRRVEAASNVSVAQMLSTLGRGTEGLSHLREGQRIFEEVGRRDVPWATAYVNEAALLLDLGRCAEARDHLLRFRAQPDLPDAPELRSSIAANLATACAGLGRLDEAVEHARAAFEAAGATGEALREATDALALANALAEAGQADEAEPYALRALEIARSSGHRHDEALALGRLASLDTHAGRHDAAIDRAGVAVSLGRRLGRPEVEATALLFLGDAMEAAGRRAPALDAYRAAVATAALDPRGNVVGAKAAERLAALGERPGRR